MVAVFFIFTSGKVEAHYEELFGTPTALTFEQVASMYEMEYVKVTSKEQFAAAITSEKQQALKLIEVFTNREENVKEHRALWTRINEVIEQWLDML